MQNTRFARDVPDEEQAAPDAFDRYAGVRSSVLASKRASQAVVQRIVAGTAPISRTLLASVGRRTILNIPGALSRFDALPEDAAVVARHGLVAGHASNGKVTVTSPSPETESFLKDLAGREALPSTLITMAPGYQSAPVCHGESADELNAVIGPNKWPEVVALPSLTSPWIKAKANGQWVGLSIRESGADVAPPWMSYDKARQRIVFATGSEKRLNEALASSGFAKTTDGYWFAKRPSSALPFLDFADPWFRAALLDISQRWPLSMVNFDPSDFAVAMGLDDPRGSKGSKKKAKGPQPVAQTVTYDYEEGAFVTTDVATAMRHDMAECPKSGKTAWSARGLAHALSMRDAFDDTASMEAMCQLIETPKRIEHPAHVKIPPEPQPGQKYDDVQVEAARHMTSMPVTSLIDDMGLGKTYSGVAYLASVREIVADRQGVAAAAADFKGMIVCPAGQRDNWTRTILSVMADPPEVRRVDSEYQNAIPGAVKYAPGADLTAPRPGGFVIVISYEGAMTDARITHRKLDATGYDEAHSAKNPTNKRTAALFPDPRDAGFQELETEFHCNMTGTETPLGAVDLFPFVSKLLGARPAMAWKGSIVDSYAPLRSDFKRFFAQKDDDDGVSQARAESRMTRISMALDAGPRLRRLKQLNVMKHRFVSELPVEDPRAIAAGIEEEMLYRRHQETKDVRERAAIESSISRLRIITAMAKVPLVANRLAEKSSKGGAVSFAYHIDVVEALNAALLKLGVDVAMTHGQNMTPRERQALVDQFQAGKYSLYLSSLFASYMGYTLVRAKYMGIAELDYSPTVLEQAEDRIYRRGQDQDVEIEYFVIARSFDGTIANNMMVKARNNDIISGDDKRRMSAIIQRPKLVFGSGAPA